MRKADCRLLVRALVVLMFSLPAARTIIAESKGTESTELTRLDGSVHPLAKPDLDAGPAPSGARMDRLTLVLRPRADASASLSFFLAEQQRFGSAQYHHWLTPEEYGRRFGIRDADLADLMAWLEGQGFRVDPAPRGRGWLNFAGTVSDVERAFATRMRKYGASDLANATEISVPSRFAGLVESGVPFATFAPKPQHRRIAISPRSSGSEAGKRPLTNLQDGTHAISPADFATIYNVAPLYAQGITGQGVRIAILGDSNVDLDDTRHFRSFFGLPANDPHVVINVSDPGVAGSESEADLDIEWSGAVAPAAEIDLVITKVFGDAVYASGQYVIDQNFASIISLSYGSCEGPPPGRYTNLWTQAAAQGISVFVSSGDTGAAGCDSMTSTTATRGKNVNGFASTPFNTAVGGTQLTGDVGSEARYWAPQNTSPTKASALSYIPEAAWNESGTVPGGEGLWSTGGGASFIFAKPSWQDAPGVPADGKRSVPDVSLSAAAYNPYLAFTGSDGKLYGFAGTSASAPSFAGIAALVSQAAGDRLGNMNPRLYELARDQYVSHGFPVFHDIVSGNNSVPGQTGYSCAEGYDLATGLGSVDASALVAAWAPSGASTCVPGPEALCLNGGRFRVSVSWTNVSSGETGTGRSVALSGDTGYFWFFSDNNIELVVKALDGRPVNGKFWLFYGALTNVEYSILVTDTTTGLSRSYFNPQGRQASVADVTAF